MDTFKISFYRLIEKVGVLFLLSLVSLPGIFPLLKSGFFPTQDGDNLIIRFADFHRAILDFHFPPRWAGYLNHTYGYPVLIFLYPGLLYIWEAIHFLGFSLLTSVKIALVLSIFLSGFFTYQFVKEIFGRLPAFISAIFYIYFPYRFVNIYLRGSFGEALGFLFVPLIFWAILKFFKESKGKYLALGSLTLALLITVHNVQALIFLPAILLFMAILLVMEEKERLRLFFEFGVFLLLALGLSCFFWLPALLERKFTVFDQIEISPFFKHFLKPEELLFFKKTIGELPLQIGIFSFLTALIAFLLIWFLKERRQKIIALFFGLVFLVSLFLIVPVSYKVWQLSRIDKFLQFPWRFLGLTGFAIAFLAALPIAQIKGKFKWLLAFFLSFGVVLNCLPYAKPLGFLYRDDNFYLTNDATTTSSNEYLPIWVKKAPTKAPPEKIEAEGVEIEIQEYKTHKRSFVIKTSEATKVQINTVYFPGWQVFVDGKKVKIDYEDNNGLLVFEVLPGEHQVLAKFDETSIRKVADFITLGSLGLIILIIIKKGNEAIFD